MVGSDDLKTIVREIENRLQLVAGADALRSKLTRDLARAHLYMKAVASGHADLIPEVLSVDLLQRYRSDNSSQPSEGSDGESDDGESGAR